MPPSSTPRVLSLLACSLLAPLTANAAGTDTASAQPIAADTSTANGRTHAATKPAPHGKAKGITWGLDFVGNIAGNPTGGVSRGFARSYWVSAKADFDLGTLVGWHNTIVHTQAAWFAGNNLGHEHIGNSISFQQTWRPVAGGRLTLLALEHKFDNGLDILLGRAPVNSYFNNSPLNCVFMSNAACLTTYGPITDIGITAYPKSSWAAKVRYNFDARFYVQTGAFEYNTALNQPGKNGLDFSTRQRTGTIVPFEVGYATDFADDRYPRRFKLGFYHNTDGGTNPYYDANGQSAALSGKPHAAQSGSRMGWYVMGDQTVWRGEGRRNLALFARYYTNTGNPAAVKWFASAGMVLTGPVASRPRDTIGVLLSNTHFDALEMRYLHDRRLKAGGTGTPHDNEIIGEINYGIAVTPGLRVLPNIQYVIHPDPIYAPTRTTDIPNAIVLGVRFDVHLAQLFGW